MRKKIMLIVPTFHQGGYERVCINTARLLEPYADVTVVVFSSEDIAYNIDGLSIIDIGIGVKKRKLGKLFHIVKRSVKVRRLKKKIRPQTAYSFGPTANMVNAFSKTKATKVWLGLRNYTDMEERIKIRLFIRLADFIICCSKGIEKELREKFHYTETTTIYNSYDVNGIQQEAVGQEPELPWKDSGTYLVSMGRDADQKGFWHMLKVFALVREKITDARLLLLGSGTFEDYRKLAEDLGIADSIYFAGMRKEPYKYLKKGSVYILTSLNEGFPNALVEGMASGLAAVSVDCRTGPAEILLEGNASWEERQKLFAEGESILWGEYGVLLPVMSPEKDLDAAHITREEKKMAEAIIHLLSNGGLLEKYRKAAVERAGIFSHQAYVEQLLSLLERIP